MCHRGLSVDSTAQGNTLALGKGVAVTASARSTQNTTIRNVADLAGVALSSVSRVLNGHPAVSESLRERVLSAVAELDYQPDFTASSLRRGQTMTVAFLVRDIVSPLFSDMVKAAENTLGPLGYSMLLMNSDGDPAREAAHLRTLARSRVDGVILSLSTESDRDVLAAVKSLRVPIVLIDRTIADVEVGSVISDHFSGLSAATRHLAGLGHERIALITGPYEVLASRERLRGYQAGLRSASVRFDAELVRMQSYDEPFGQAQTASLLALERPATAVIAGGAMLAYGVLRAIRESGRPVAMIACDSWRSPELFEPSVTVVRRDVAEMGRTAAELLRVAIDTGETRSVTLPTELVLGTDGNRAAPVSALPA